MYIMDSHCWSLPLELNDLVVYLHSFISMWRFKTWMSLPTFIFLSNPIYSKNQSHSNFNWLEVVPIIIFLYKLPCSTSHPSVLQLLDHKAYLSCETTHNDEHGVLHQETSVEILKSKQTSLVRQNRKGTPAVEFL